MIFWGGHIAGNGYKYLQMGSALKMVCQFLVNMAPTTESPALQPPAGASVTDWSSESEALPILPQ